VAKQCPKCGRPFPDNAKHCDRDGFDLVNVSGSAPSLGILVIWAATALVIAGSLGVVARAYIRSSIRISIPEDAHIELRLDKGAPTLLFDVALLNSSRFPIHLSEIQYRVMLGPKDQLSGSKAVPLDIPAGASLRMPVKLVSADKAMFASAQAFAASGTSRSATIHADLSVCLLRCFNVPVQSLAPVNFVRIAPPPPVPPLPITPPVVKPAAANPPRVPAPTDPARRPPGHSEQKKGRGKS
jgi:hypothetical protein